LPTRALGRAGQFTESNQLGTARGFQLRGSFFLTASSLA
jgi:hypothetical protein